MLRVDPGSIYASLTKKRSEPNVLDPEMVVCVKCARCGHRVSSSLDAVGPHIGISPARVAVPGVANNPSCYARTKVSVSSLATMSNAVHTRPPVILVVDDEALLRMLAVDHFEEAGYEVMEAANGAEALYILHRRPDIAAVVTDVHMPGQPDGFALSHKVREVRKDCAIVAS